MAKELDTIINFDGEPYNINAAKAEKVQNALKIKKSLFDESNIKEKVKIEEASFDGSAEKIIDYVPASGGMFTGNVYANSVGDTEIEDESVLNYYDIKEKVLKNLLTNSVLYTWDGNALLGKENGSDIKNIGIVTGEAADVNAFAESNKYSKKFPAYIYIATDGKIYFGTSDSPTPSGVEVSAENAISADQLTHVRTLTVDLEADAGTGRFNGTDDVNLGVTGILAEKNGGTGRRHLREVTVGKATQLEHSRAIQVDLGCINGALFNGTQNIQPGVTGILAEKNGGTGRQDLKDVTVGTAESILVKVLTSASSSDERSNIIISPSGPSASDGKNGDIWIKY